LLICVALIVTWPSRKYDGQLIVLLMLAYAVHRFVCEWLRNDTPADPLTNAWVTFGGWCFVLATGRANLGLMLMPATAVAVALPALLVGLWRWGPDGHRVAITVSTFIGFFLVAGRPDNWYWGLMIAPLLPLGVAGFFTPTRK
jgi:hypothetical protein